MRLIASKMIPDTRGFYKEYAWYTDGARHFFMFGDINTAPSEDYADWVENDTFAAYQWFHSCEGWD